MFDPIEFGKRIQKARLKKGFTQEQLADVLNVGRPHVTKMERGARACSVDFLVDLADALNVSTDYLLGGTEQITDILRSLEDAITKLQNIVDSL